MIADYKSLAPNEGRTSRRENREVYGRMDLAQTARQTAEAAPAAAGTRGIGRRTRPGAAEFPASAGTGTAPIDPALLIKGGIVIVVAVGLHRRDHLRHQGDLRRSGETRHGNQDLGPADDHPHRP